MQDFWHTLPKPFFALAPLDDVTDAAFRRLIAKYGKPDVMFTEFTSADGLVLAPEEGKKKLLKKLIFSEEERPIVAQLFTSVPEHMEEASHLCAKLGFNGIDINMGCPDKAIEKGGCGAALIKKPSLARELIRAAKKCGLPVSVKTRIGYNKDELETWLPELLAEEPAAVTIHARTRKEMSDVPARWGSVARAVEIRDTIKSSTLIIGNGDVEDIADARKKAEETKCDGVMLGRAIFGNPWLFMDVAHPYIPTSKERCRALIEHLTLFDELLSGTTSYATMKKHFKSYISGWNGAKELRARLMETESIAQAGKILVEVVDSTK
ncbi:hypothetical protein A3A40_01670 [Candidatus Kaiserbacteria bacterium RIFCSPLOWO2_01_FULL_54_20]|uniref:tRNA-dihydrouridine synthase n=1 Tax=Candidatus Kaiserbacteria bacterium RIFCSPLOWO2_01_FULL_54_20 TaxID=1798513 RepID=A0A1F6EK39_9BACT|nr:MAG: hypothetical protein A3A40_01670 [Candidatus Kaiserbacteria bacterium RIFCSPLOWO2_01_FULL_54_20]